MRSRYLVDGASVVAVALFLGWVLSLATTRVKNWFVMSDELYYERLAVSVAQTGSLLPRVHGEVVSNVNQLYPLLLSTMYGSGNVPASLEGAHRLNAFVIATAAIPVYLLARRVGVGRILAVAAGGLAAAVPWVVLSSFLLTEVVAYPAFCWALLAIVYAVERKTWVWDAVALAAIAVAVLARTQFVVLVGALPIAVVAEAVLTVGARRAAAELWRLRRPLVLLYAVLLAVALVAVASGNGSRLLGSYSVTAENVRIDLDLVQLTFAHVATIALSFAILPFIVGLGWLVDRIRPSAAPPERAFALVGASAFVLLAVQVASFTQRFGAGLVKDRYLFYVAPIVIVALAAAIGSRTWPRWWALAVPAAVAAVGFAWIPVARYEKLNVDTPIAMLNDALLDLATSETWARALLVLLTAVVLQALLLARAFLPWRPVAAAVAAIALVALPLETAYAFERLFRVNGTNGLPITLDQGVVFSWIDRNVGPTGRVTVFKYPVGGADWWAGQGYWWDVEFWNESAVETPPTCRCRTRRTGRRSSIDRTGEALRRRRDQFALFHGTTFASGSPGRSGSSTATPTSSRRSVRGAPTWLTKGSGPTDGRGATHPPVISVFAEPGQTSRCSRFLTIGTRRTRPGRPRVRHGPLEPGRVGRRDRAASSRSSRWSSVCVPPDRPGDRDDRDAGDVAGIYRDPTEGGRPTGASTARSAIHLRYGRARRRDRPR